MAKDEEYELLPHSEIAKLKEEIRRLKNPNDYEPSSAPVRMDSSIEDLKESIDTLNEIFKEASMELRVGDSDLHSHLKKLANLSDKLDTIIDQNEKIAEAIVSVAESTDEIKQKVEEQRLTPSGGESFKDFGNFDSFKKPEPPSAPPPMPSMGGSSFGGPEPRGFPPPQMGGMNMGGPMPPPPGNPGMPPPGGPPTPPGALGPPQSGGNPLPPMPKPERKKQQGMFGFR